MKNLFILFILLFPLKVSFGQTFKLDPNPSGRDKYMIDTVATSPLSQIQLYSNANAFLANKAQYYSLIPITKNKDEGELSFSGRHLTYATVFDTTSKGKVKQKNIKILVSFVSKIYTKENKFKVVLNNIRYQTVQGFDPSYYDPIDSKYFKLENRATTDVAVAILKNISSSLNQKPENDF